MSSVTRYTRVLVLAVMSLASVVAAASGGAARSGALASPRISSFTPHAGPVGSAVAIRGSGLLGGSVAFNGVSTGVQVTYSGDTSSDYQLTATVPPGATTGVITVTVGGATASTSTQFAVTPGNLIPAKGKPVIAGFAPERVNAGAMVTLSGANLGEPLSIKVGGARVMFYRPLGPTVLSVRIPRGARTGKIVVVTPLGTAVSPRPVVIG